MRRARTTPASTSEAVPPPAPGGTAADDSGAQRADQDRQRQPEVPPMAPARVITGSTIIILAVTLLGFLVWIAFGSRLYYARARHDAYANFRYELATATAPTGPPAPL